MYKFWSFHFTALETFWLIAYVLAISKPTIFVNAASPAVRHFSMNCIKSHLIFAILFKDLRLFITPCFPVDLRDVLIAGLVNQCQCGPRRHTMLQSTL